jgi:hypothetical protein
MMEVALTNNGIGQLLMSCAKAHSTASLGAVWMKSSKQHSERDGWLYSRKRK